MVQGIILAGGFSSRAISNKMLFDFDGKPLIWHAINGMRPFVDRIIVVTGRYDQEIKSALRDEKDIVYAYNKDYSKGMFSSVKTGVTFADGDFFILPGDCPFVSRETYELILKGTKPVRFPRCGEKDGHPLFIKASLKESLLNEPDDSNLKAFRNRQDYEVIMIDDPNVSIDIDTQEDYQSVLKERNK